MRTFRWLENEITTGHGVLAQCWVVRGLVVNDTHVSGNLSLFLDLPAFLAGRALLDNATFSLPYADMADVSEGWVYEQLAASDAELGTSHSGEVSFLGRTIHVVQVPT